MKVLDIALRLVLVAGGVVALVAIWSILTGTDSPLRAGNGSAARAGLCLGCNHQLLRADVVHCSKCLGV